MYKLQQSARERVNGLFILKLYLQCKKVRGEDKMSIQALKEEKRNYHKGEEDIKTPDFYCASCAKRYGKQCTFYKRHIEPDYNRCFNHSYYSPDTASFVVLNNIEEIIKLEEAQVA